MKNLQSNTPINLSNSQPITKAEASTHWGVHSCQHDGFEHICGCDVKRDHPALNP